VILQSDELITFVLYILCNTDVKKDKCQMPAKTILSLPLLSWTGERKYDERLEG